MASRSCEPRRIAVLGSPGSGKTTFALRRTIVTGLPLIHLDDLYWHPGWTRTPDDQWPESVARRCAKEAWIIDGTTS